ncbi:MAG: nucleotidyltransferase domain-containing protein [Candidatus Omnitrophica bacterium]|nr:nucleotidyltransferase domain-containing protein [Candidatus Omnitrophota bacterium]
MKAIFKISTLIILLILPSLSLEISYRGDLSFRRIRGDSILNFFQERQGKVYSGKELTDLGFSEAELSQLVSANRLVEIKVDRRYYTDENYPGNFYLLPRETIINPGLVQALNLGGQSSGPVAQYFTYPRTVESFNQELKNTVHFWKNVYQALMDTRGLEKFEKYFIPEVIRIVGDDFETLYSIMGPILTELAERLESDLYGIDETEFNYSLEAMLNKARKEMELREAYAQEHNIEQELSNLVASLKDVLSGFQDRILGIVIRGSWARGRPTETSDLDFLIVSERGIDEELARQLQEKIRRTTGKETHDLSHLISTQLITEDPETFQNALGFDETTEFNIYVRNFIIITPDEITLDKIASQLTKAKPLP